MDYPLSRQAVWRATLIAMSFYPLETTNYDQGLIKTKILTEGDSWKPVFRSINSEHIYTINVNVFNYGGRTRVSIDKKLNRKASFERNEQELKTLGVEEDMLLYRIKRELLIDRLIKKYFK